MKPYFLLLPLLALFACNNIPWSEEDRDIFVESCLQGATDSLKAEIDVREYCTCIQQRLEAEYSVREIEEQEIKLNEYLQMQRDCLEEQHHKGE